MSVVNVLKGKSVLVVDDNKDVSEYLDEVLSHAGADVQLAEDGLFAVGKVKLNPDKYDLILLDWMMPGMSGYEVAKELQNSPTVPDIPIIIVTAKDDDVVRATKGEVNIKSCLFKPVSEHELLGEICSVLDIQDNKVIDEEAENESTGSELNLEGKHILVVDDVPFNREFVVMLLETLGISSKEAANGEEALALLDESNANSDGHKVFDMVLMDMQMPIMDGYDATRILKKNPELSPIPVIALTANALAEDRQKCLDAGVDDYLSKPLDNGKFIAMLTKWFEKANHESVTLAKKNH